MSEFESKWNLLTSSTTPSEEIERAKTLAAFARAHAIRYRLALSDPNTRTPIALIDLDRLSGVPMVHLTLERPGKGAELIWKPRAKESIYPLLSE